MIYTFKEQLLMIIYFMIVGMFLGVMFDLINLFFCEKKVLNYIIQITLWGIVTIICVISVDKISNGYLPLYVILFFIIGYIIYYYLLKKQFERRINNICKYKKDIKKIVFPIEIIDLIKNKNKKFKQNGKK